MEVIWLCLLVLKENYHFHRRVIKITLTANVSSTFRFQEIQIFHLHDDSLTEHQIFHMYRFV